MGGVCSIRVQRLFYVVIRQQGQEVDNSSPSDAGVKREWICTSSSTICHHGIDRERFTILCGMHGREEKYIEKLFRKA